MKHFLDWTSEHFPIFSERNGFSAGLLLWISLGIFSLALLLLRVHMAIATLAFAFMLTGLYFRKKRNLHLRFMGAALLMDLLVVLSLEVQRNAVKTAVAMTLPLLQQAHILMSSLAMLFFVPTLIFGFKLYRGNPSPRLRLWHRRAGILAFVFRTLGFFLMFSMLSKEQG